MGTWWDIAIFSVNFKAKIVFCPITLIQYDYINIQLQYITLEVKCKTFIGSII